MSDNVLTDLRKLSLGSMAEALHYQIQQPGTYDDLSFSERLSLLVDYELQCRHQRRKQRLIRAADFRLAATRTISSAARSPSLASATGSGSARIF